MDKPLVYQLFCQEHSWVAMFGLDKRWKHLSVKPTPRWDFPLLIRSLEDYQLIGRACKWWEPFSLPVLMTEDLTTQGYVNFKSISKTQFERILQHSRFLLEVSFLCSPEGIRLSTIPVVIAVRPHLFPFRTQKLSSLASTILGWQRPGKIDCCRIKFLDSSVGRAFGC